MANLHFETDLALANYLTNNNPDSIKIPRLRDKHTDIIGQEIAKFYQKTPSERAVLAVIYRDGKDSKVIQQYLTVFDDTKSNSYGMGNYTGTLATTNRHKKITEVINELEKQIDPTSDEIVKQAFTKKTYAPENTPNLQLVERIEFTEFMLIIQQLELVHEQMINLYQRSWYKAGLNENNVDVGIEQAAEHIKEAINILCNNENEQISPATDDCYAITTLKAVSINYAHNLAISKKATAQKEMNLEWLQHQVLIELQYLILSGKSGWEALEQVYQIDEDEKKEIIVLLEKIVRQRFSAQVLTDKHFLASQIENDLNIIVLGSIYKTDKLEKRQIKLSVKGETNPNKKIFFKNQTLNMEDADVYESLALRFCAITSISQNTLPDKNKAIEAIKAYLKLRSIKMDVRIYLYENLKKLSVPEIYKIFDLVNHSVKTVNYNNSTELLTEIN